MEQAESIELRKTTAWSAYKKKNSPHWLNLMYLPAFLLFVVFIVYPFVNGLRISFTNWNGYSQTFDWVGLDSYRRMFTDPNFWRVFRNTLIYGMGSSLLENLFGLAYALLLNQKLLGRGFTRTVIYVPVIVSPLIMGYVFYFFFQFRGGALNDIVLLFQDKPLNLLADPHLNVWIITSVSAFHHVGTAMIIYLAGLQTISKEYYEAAEIDGASSWSRFLHVTLPLLMPAITVNIVLNLINGLKMFDAVVALTGGGPGYSSQSLSTMMYKMYFAAQDAGYAAALGNFMFVFIALISLTALSYLRRKETD